MKAGIYLGKEKIEIRELPLPEVGDDDVLIQNIYSSICGTDVAVFMHGPNTGHKVNVGGEFGHETISRVVKVGKNVKDFTYLRFGSRSSDVTVILYNKSLEMREVKHKDYIYQKWLQSGLDVSKDIWRLEFSLKSKAKYFVDTSSGEVQTLTLDCIFNNVFIKELATGLTKRYFRFVDPKTATRKSRMKDIALLDTSGAVIDRVNIKNNTDVTMREKILLKNMFRLSQSHSSIPSSVSDEANTIKDWLTRTPALEDYYNKKKHEWAQEFQNPHRDK